MHRVYKKNTIERKRKGTENSLSSLSHFFSFFLCRLAKGVVVI